MPKIKIRYANFLTSKKIATYRDVSSDMTIEQLFHELFGDKANHRKYAISTYNATTKEEDYSVSKSYTFKENDVVLFNHNYDYETMSLVFNLPLLPSITEE